MTPMKPTLAALMLSVALAAPALAQDRLTGTVAESFGGQIVVQAPQGRILLTLPEGVAAPAPGARIEAEGRAVGQTFAATRLTATTGLAPVPAAAPYSGPVTGLPPELARLGLTEVVTRHERSRSGSHEVRIHGRLSDGGWLRAKTRGGRLVETKASTAVPQALVEALLPASVHAGRELADFSRITEIGIKREGEIEVEGIGREGTRLEVEYWPDGRLKKYEREGSDRRRLMTEEAARAELGRLGYHEVGFVSRGGKHVDAVARNPYGEWVEVRLNDRGRIDRERAFTR
ncbi:hypothetical protein [Pannonibacter indicus]|uniref:hypothetical protein n=1 Tax=Pannonibacter indicus TaxID=466044 RepID=UPI0039192DD8